MYSGPQRDSRVSRLLTHNKVLELFQYDPETGLFTYIKGVKGVWAGTVCTVRDNNGYVKIGFNYRPWKAHRLAFLYMNGRLPDGEVDHINGIRDDNRWENLREVTHQQNLANRKILTKTNKTGVVGVCVCSATGKFRATATRKGKHIHLGKFDTLDEARRAREEFLNNESY